MPSYSRAKWSDFARLVAELRHFERLALEGDGTRDEDFEVNELLMRDRQRLVDVWLREIDPQQGRQGATQVERMVPLGTLLKFARMVEDMRTAQRRYFRGRGSRVELLETARDLEEKLDTELKEILTLATPSMFERFEAAQEGGKKS